MSHPRSDHDEPTTGIDPLRALGKQLPYDRPDAARREAVRSSLLVAAADTTPHRPRRTPFVAAGFVAGALAAAAVAILLVRAPSSSQPEHIARVDAPAAELEHTSIATASGVDEVVRVRAGTVRLSVPAVRSGNRVRTRTGNAEVEGTGAYEVVVAHDRLASVHVSAGTAKVIVEGQSVFLATGERWSAPIVAEDLPIAPASSGPVPTSVVEPSSSDASMPSRVATSSDSAPVRHDLGEIKSAPVAPLAPIAPPSASVASPSASLSASPHAASTSRVAPPSPTMPSVTSDPSPLPTPTPTKASPIDPPVQSPTEQHFQAGWALLRANKHDAAAAELALAAAGTGPLASDARYFQVVALAKAGRGREAESALVAFLDGAPTSARRGRAAVMLGRLIAARGDRTSAKAWFEVALTDGDPSVVSAAKAELAR